MSELMLCLGEPNLDPVRIRKGLPMDGVVYFTLDGQAFPGDNWFDLIGVDLENWLPALLSFARNHTDSCAFGFMDGPYGVKLTRNPSGEVTARFFEGHRTVVAETVIKLPVFLTSAAACVRKLSYALYEATPDSVSRDDINALGSIAAELRTLAIE